ncbi:anhydro-N-acetylmuramic acid kinase [Gallaecimonas sp. GXIMD4217]|uniref:anhydro-N-acetylmuramic acid kinase n=1 Tax=Gallaecimonas sp. GXIMD4217 TaxID=3131927 RepID=UPI00311AE300
MRYIGLMCGTSMDGIDAVLVRFEDGLQLEACHLEPLPPTLCEQLHGLCQSGGDHLEAVMAASLAFANASADAVKALLAKTGLAPDQIRAIGSHGQTIRHRPELGYSVQIGDAATLAARTGIDVVSNFRMKDLALGGQGAPLVPAFHQAVLPGARAVLNIGGIANLTWLGEPVLGFDTGPGNTLMDAWCRRHLDRPFDEGGQFAASGRVLPELLQRLLAEPYFQRPWPKSTGRELFHLDWLQSQLDGSEAPRDVQATLLALTVESIALHLERLAARGQVLVCGGGARNPVLMTALAQRLPALAWDSTDSQGVPGDWLEAMAFAWLAKRFMDGLPGNLPAVTGAGRAAVLGQLTPAG